MLTRREFCKGTLALSSMIVLPYVPKKQPKSTKEEHFDIKAAVKIFEVAFPEPNYRVLVEEDDWGSAHGVGIENKKRRKRYGILFEKRFFEGENPRRRVIEVAKQIRRKL